MNIGPQVLKARKAMKLNQREYGELVGLPQQTISRIEAGSGVRSDTIDLLIKKGGLVWTDKGPRAKAA
jgi:transcriptional regulator with XRE-family HTH domain